MKEGKYIFDAQAEDEISDFLYEKIGEKLHDITGIPLFMEASAWCTFASVGDIYEEEEFKIEVRSRYA